MGFLEARLSITLTTDVEIARLAGEFGRRRRPTDVLAFSMLEGEGVEFRGDTLGDVIISVEMAARQAAERGVPLDDELGDLLLHGLLHVVGMDHERPADARAMRELEGQLRWTLAEIG